MIANLVVAVPIAMATLNFAVHMRLGARIVIEDYVHRPVLKAFLLTVNTGTAYGVAIVAILAVTRVSVLG